MPKPNSIRARLSLVFALFLFLVSGVGLFGINRLSTLNEASVEIRGHWLRAAPLLGELNNLISDFRAAEANSLIAIEAQDLSAAGGDLGGLSKALQRTQFLYESIDKDDAEMALYRRFIAQWEGYRAVADRGIALAAEGRHREAVAFYRTTSLEAFNAASATLASLVDHNVEGARLATERETDVYHVSRTLILVAILFAALSLVAAIVYITRSISDPLLDLTGRMHRLADNETSIDIHGAARSDEIGEMARAVLVFRDNAVKLVQSELTLRQQADALRAALDAERRLTTQQQNFVSMTSHEFRTPLTIIDSHAQRMIRMKERLPPAQLAERAGGIRAAVTRMTSLIDSLLNTSRVFDGDVGLRREVFELVGLIRQACQMHREVAPGAMLLDKYRENSISMGGDPRLVYQAVSNLISNAIKYSPPASPIDIEVTMEHGEARIVVTDCGIGIPDKDRTHLFERYFRGSNVSEIAGTGVGLYLVAMVAKLHGGSVRADGVEGGGSRFTLMLPLFDPQLVADQARQ